MIKRQASLLSFGQSTYKRQGVSEEKADDDQDQESDDLIAKVYRLMITQRNQNMI